MMRINPLSDLNKLFTPLRSVPSGLLVISCWLYSFSLPAQKVTEKLKAQELKLVQSNNLKAARYSLDSLIKVNPTAEAYFERGYLKMIQGDMKGAREDYRKTVEMDPSHARAHINIGVLNSMDGKYEASLVEYKLALKSGTDDYTVYNDIGWIYYLQKKYKEAIAQYNLAIKADPSFEKPWLNKVCALNDMGDHVNAMKVLDSLVILLPHNGNAYLTRAKMHVQDMDVMSAISDYDLALVMDPENPLVYVLRADFRFNSLNDKKGALEDCNKAITRSPTDANGYILRSQVRLAMHDYEASFEDSNTAIGNDSLMGKAYIQRGVIEGMMGKYTSAVSDFDKAIQLDPKDNDPHLRKASLYRDKSDYAAALNALTTALQKLPGDNQLLLERGGVYVFMKEYKKAIGDLDAVVKSAEQKKNKNSDETIKVRALFIRGVAKDSLHQRKEAFQDMAKAKALGSAEAQAYIIERLSDQEGPRYFQFLNFMKEAAKAETRENYRAAIAFDNQAIALVPDSAMPYYDRGIMYRKLGVYDSAIWSYKMALKASPGLSDAWMNMGLVYKYLGDTTEAEHDFREALRTNPSNFRAYMNMGSLYFDKGQYQEAIPFFLKTLTYQTDYTKAYLQAGECYLKLGDKEHACYYYKLAEDLGDGSASVKRIMNCSH